MRIVRWFILRGILAACLWAGLVHGVQGAKNVALVMVWIVSVVSLLLALGREKHVAEEAKKPPTGNAAPRWIVGTIDAVFGGFLVWHGYVWAGVFYLLHIAILQTFNEEVEKRRAELAEKEATAQ